MTGQAKYKVAIADDEPLFREGLSLLINRHQILQCNVTAGNGKELIDALGNMKDDFPNLVLCDIEMPVLDGIDTTKKLHALYPDLKIVMLSLHYDSAIILKMMELGASAFMPKHEKSTEFYKTIINVIEKGFHYNDYIIQLIRDRMVAGVDHQQLIKQELTSREVEILKLICEQKTNKEIGQELFISARTVEGHRNKLLDKTQSKNTAGLIIFAIENGFVDVNIKNQKWQ